MRHKLQSSLQLLLLPLIAGVAMGQMSPPSAQPAGAPAGTPTSPDALRSIFATSFASRLAAADTTTVSITPGGIVPLYSTSTTIQPGSFVSIYGQNLATGTFLPPASGYNFPPNMGGTSVKVNGKQAYMYFAGPTQIDIEAPDDTARGTVQVVVTTPSGSGSSTVNLGDFGPSFLTYAGPHAAGIIIRTDGSGSQQGGAYDFLGPTGSSLGFPTVAAKAEDTIELFGVGFGPTDSPVPAGQPYQCPAAGCAKIPASSGLAVFINGTAVTPFFAGVTQTGVFQFNITIPAGLGTGDVPLTAMVGGVQTPTGVVISLQ